jgi:hypothetical protein
LQKRKTDSAAKSVNTRLARKLAVFHQLIVLFADVVKEISKCSITIANPSHIMTKSEYKKHERQLRELREGRRGPPDYAKPTYSADLNRARTYLSPLPLGAV